MAASTDSNSHVELVPGGIQLASEVVPLFSGAVHYFQLEPSAWRPALEAVKSLGFRLIDTYIPWGVHETAPGELDLGGKNPRLDVVRFLKLAAELGFYCIVRPGPHINAELTRFGIPERVLWDEACQARSAGGKPVVLPVPPLAFPVPSYASEAFHAEVAQWLSAIGAALAPLRWPNGPIVLLQIDNEGAMYFRDGVYDQDYHPDSIAAYRRFLQERYGHVENLRSAYENPAATFSKLDPPRRFSAATAAELAAHLDWAEFQEQLLADAFSRMDRTLKAAGLAGIPTSHNLPLSEGATPLDPERIGRVVDLIGLDYYHGASVPARWAIARRTSELATRSEARGHPVFACELGAGFPPFFPPLTEGDNAFTVMTALAYGLRGFNAYMLVERDRWVGAPIDPHGRRRASAGFWRRLVSALDRTRFQELERSTEVHLVLPRSLRRLARVRHAFGPLSAALFQVAGGGAEQGCFEDDLDDTPVVIETERFIREVERALDDQGVAHAVIGGDLIEHALKRAKWVIVASSGGLEAEITESVVRALRSGKSVTLGPRAPERDATMRRLRAPAALSGTGTVPALIRLDPTQIRNAVEQAVRQLNLPKLSVEPREVFVTLHHDASGLPTVLFVINPTERDLIARVDAVETEQAVDALSGQRFFAEANRFQLELPRRTVRMLELRDYS